MACMSAPRAREDSMRPRRFLGASGRPLNFTVRRLTCQIRTSSQPLAPRAHLPGLRKCPQLCFFSAFPWASV